MYDGQELVSAHPARREDVRRAGEKEEGWKNTTWALFSPGWHGVIVGNACAPSLDALPSQDDDTMIH